MDRSGRGTWSSKLGFLLAAVGSAVGLGNMWRFSATASSSGGAAFVLLYIVFTFVIGIPLLLAELTLGRRMRLSPIGALRDGVGRGWAPVGVVFAAAGFLILSFYSVIAGWALRYGVETLAVGFPAEPGNYFAEVATGKPAIAYHLLFVAATAVVVMAGIRHGIERAALILMPTLFLMLVAMAVWAAMLPGGGDGYAFYLAPKLEELLDTRVLAEAAGQAYFSLSLGMGALLTYASYLDQDHNLSAEGAAIALCDFSVAFTAGLVIFPIVFALGFSGQVIGLSGDEAEGVLFIALPGAFSTMGSLSRLAGIVFFAALIFAALTSTISMMEIVVSSLVDETRLSRRRAVLFVGSGVALVGVAPALSLRVLSVMNTIVGELFLGLGTFLTAVAVGWFMRNPVSELVLGAGPLSRRLLPGWYAMIRYVVPAVTAIVFVYMVLGALDS